MLALILAIATVAASQSAAVETWPVAAEQSQVRISVGKSGLFRFAGHDHTIVAPAVSGHVRFEPATLAGGQVEVSFDAAALRVDPEGEPEGDVPKVQEVMAGPEVLDVARYPTIAFRSTDVRVENPRPDHARLRLTGELTLRGVTRPVTVTVELARSPGRLGATGKLTIKQSDFGIKPVTAGLGTVRVKDEVEVSFTLVAIKPASTEWTISRTR